ncbi:hypothetical protein ACFPAF_17050 [Hymenobacter endophyticus]|uniref:DUF4304 domain-containing protein n=1 Tax=Hymenobacter endophyticus TaxID=3076335 RepID=A0ABU3TL73_9BACT|nr:hypothetical protein [Hymenobacter endophyticus]MDU0372113.1 hypothetical protein [Hymenobacter endophyticus]
MSAPTTTVPLPGPRDLGPSVGQLLRRLGFTVWEQPTPTPSLSLVTGTWTGLTGEQFRFQYAHHHPAAGPVAWAACQMSCLPPGAREPQVCFANTQVRRLREVRLLVLGNDHFAAARQRLQAARPAATFSSDVHPSLP